MIYIGYAGRDAEKFHHEGNREVKLEFSATLGQHLATLLTIIDPMGLNKGPLGELRQTLKEIGFK